MTRSEQADLKKLLAASQVPKDSPLAQSIQRMIDAPVDSGVVGTLDGKLKAWKEAEARVEYHTKALAQARENAATAEAIVAEALLPPNPGHNEEFQVWWSDSLIRVVNRGTSATCKVSVRYAGKNWLTL